MKQATIGLSASARAAMMASAIAISSLKIGGT